MYFIILTKKIVSIPIYLVLWLPNLDEAEGFEIALCGWSWGFNPSLVPVHCLVKKWNCTHL